eukprot:evm.model.NODE_38224_length_1271_cov_10.885130.1
MEEVWEEGKRRKKNLVAPEVVLGGDASPMSDCWSVGCLLSLLLLSRPLFDARSNVQLMEHVYRVVGSYEGVWK